MKNAVDVIKQNRPGLVAILAVLEAIATGFGFIYGATAWVGNTARDAVLNEAFLATLSKRVRPICVFDSKGSVKLDPAP
jgi:hypothetical protein